MYLNDTAGLRTEPAGCENKHFYNPQGVFPQQNEQGRIHARAAMYISIGIVDILSRLVILEHCSSKDISCPSSTVARLTLCISLYIINLCITEITLLY